MNTRSCSLVLYNSTSHMVVCDRSCSIANCVLFASYTSSYGRSLVLLKVAWISGLILLKYCILFVAIYSLVWMQTEKIIHLLLMLSICWFLLIIGLRGSSTLRCHSLSMLSQRSLRLISFMNSLGIVVSTSNCSHLHFAFFHTSYDLFLMNAHIHNDIVVLAIGLRRILVSLLGPSWVV